MISRLRTLFENAWPGLMLKCQVKWEKYEFHRGSDTIEHFQTKNLVALLKLSNNYSFHLWHLVIHIRVMYVPCRQPVDKCLPIDWRPFRELIQYPRKSKPYLTYDRSEPQTKSTINRMCYSVMEEEWQNYQSHDYNSSIWCELGGWNRNNSWKWLCSICGPEKAMEISD